MKFNINGKVKVKLTDLGVQELKKQHDELNDYVKLKGGNELGEFNLHLDKDGYKTFHLWDLMNIFGHMMMMGTNLPFETEIILDSKSLY